MYQIQALCLGAPHNKKYLVILCELYTSCVSIVTFAYVNATILTQLV